MRPTPACCRLRLLPLLPAILLPAPASAQGGALPTLSEAGLEYLSESGFLQVTLSGQLDLEAFHVGRDRWAGLVGGPVTDSVPVDWRTACADCHADSVTAFRGESGPVLAHRLRVFADVFLGDNVYSLVEVRSDRGHAPADGELRVRIEQAFVRIASADGSEGVQVGRFASPFGSYPLRHLTPLDPFLRPPLAYDYRTVMSRSHAPPDAASLLDWKEWPELFRGPGAPPIWDVPYQWGTMAFGRVGPLDLRAALVGGAPSSAPEAWTLELERLEHPSWVLGARARLSPSLEVGASYDRGPWLEEIEVGAIGPVGGAPARSRWDHDQELISADVSYARGPVMARAEAILDRWDVPNVAERLEERLYSAEVQWDVGPGWSVALRGGLIDFRPLGDGTGARADWDYDVHRVEASLGWRPFRNGGILLSGYHQDAADARPTLLVGVRTWWSF
ncbi:MAG TPA: hypothetical protein VFQ22_13145 [Longimicrobiales bacterium]|nr:hypothetical protein [Longimicrobiales bacterium]